MVKRALTTYPIFTGSLLSLNAWLLTITVHCTAILLLGDLHANFAKILPLIIAQNCTLAFSVDGGPRRQETPPTAPSPKRQDARLTPPRPGATPAAPGSTQGSSKSAQSASVSDAHHYDILAQSISRVKKLSLFSQFLYRAKKFSNSSTKNVSIFCR